MADVLTPEQRSLCMSRIRSKDTAPEQAVRLILRALGIRYRLHSKRLSGHPDIVIASRRLAILVHGCFWHRHTCRLGRPMPATNSAFWREKFDRNRARDRVVRKELRRAGWHVVTIWECQTRKPARLVSVVETLIARYPVVGLR